MYKKGLVFLILMLIVLPSVAFAQETKQVISNSEDWKDVYSAILYANLNNFRGDFLVSTKHAESITNNLAKETPIEIITSEKTPFVLGYENTLKSKGYSQVDEKLLKNPNLELLDELSGITNFIVVDNRYGYNAIAVAPYAVLTKSWVLLLDNVNVIEAADLLGKRKVDAVLIYGYVDREITRALGDYNPKAINTGDKFEDNIELVKEYLKIKSTKQVLLTNGEFIEKEIMSGSSPILFTGRENVPEQISKYLKGPSGIEVGVLIGNELVGAATNIRKTAGINVIVKFARGARSSNTGVSGIEGLDLFYLPAPFLKLELESIEYNPLVSQLQVTYKSSSSTPIYFKGSINLISESEKIKVGDFEPEFMGAKSFKTITYPDITLKGGSIDAELYTLYGETPGALDRILEQKVNVKLTNVLDNCEIELLSAKYNKQKEYFKVKVKNIGETDCWAEAEINDIEINNRIQDIGSESPEKIPRGKSRELRINQGLDEQDLEENSRVSITVYYGENENHLINIIKGSFMLETEILSLSTYMIIAIIIILLILILLYFKKKGKKQKIEV